MRDRRPSFVIGCVNQMRADHLGCDGDPQDLHDHWNDPAVAALKRNLIAELHHRLTQTEIALPRGLGHV